ncbi:cobyrinate a,c-diamide synthase [Comamonas thiooxydans]|uniref:Cobyrinic acid a,c-diamide synthase n=1 Tax=Comamonas thiooxydans TaxID=363952 RepID=A0A0E3CB63_9BURK|nr:cobyrinate a,c-diamide synthase [Comamonas thiooxydans]KGH04539.1 cobyrinic acid a,c-diamide synthase [Comamonas thiooxydans]KGH18580.1 cobyrinic acid a,c-diamide synthase [Comamonas thiooxydans]KGH19542.1 cobyrinic acid a,c-diamide synthase [Comamonas thiooxydans]
MTVIAMHEPGPRCPALLISAPASGQGKTTITAALARLHARQGRKVRVFKCGPDFLDPYWHELASGSPVHSVDLWMTGEGDVRQRLHEAAQEADLILVEGVMGLFDGNFSAGDLALLLGLPVLAVVDASAMAGTFGALAYGLQHYRDGLRWAGMLANRVATAHHADLLRQGLREQSLWLGAMPGVQLGDAAVKAKSAALLPERHLGLIAAHELGDALQRLDAAADALAQTPLGQRAWSSDDGQPSWQDWCVDFAAPDMSGDQARVEHWLSGRRIAIARDAAFSFIYPANLDCLRVMGAELCFFSPLAGDALPPCDAIWLPGGYPELHARALHENRQLRDGIAEHMAQGKPVWAECGGMLALCDGVTALDGCTQPMWGLLPGQVVMQSRLGGLGMQQLALDMGLLRGHTFHYTRLETAMPVLTRSSRPGAAVQADRGEALYQYGSVRASYFHAWFPSCPSAVAALFGATIED